MPNVNGYSGRRADDTPPPQRRASDSDAWLVIAALFQYAVPVETVVRRPERPLPFGMFRRVGRTDRLAARSGR
jgi:hypothetical protein